jgi:uncharacterized membrane protein
LAPTGPICRGPITRLFRWWFAFGFPAFAAVAAIFWLMTARPVAG